MSTRTYTLMMIGIVIAILAVGMIVAANSPSASNGMDTKGVASVPPGRAYLDGQEIYFIHTEVSDADVAKVLSSMMNSPVIYVPALSQVPASALANVYVFKNGIKGMGPLGFQPDIFDNPPGSTGYSPLRRLTLITWKDTANTRELKSLAEIQSASSRGEITLEQTTVVINMPFITWPGGKR
jgi:hypothetical protein